MMDRRSLGRVLGAALLAGLAAARPALAETDQVAVEAAIEQFRLLMLKPDKARLEALMAPGLTYGHSDRRVMNRAEIIDSFMSGRSRFNAITLSDQTVQVAGDLAIVRHRFQADAISNGVPASPDIRILQVWHRTPAGWVLVVRQAH